MLRCCRANAAGAKPIAWFPLDFHSILKTSSFHFCFIRSLKNSLPVESETVLIVAYVHYFLLYEPLPDPRIDRFEDLMTIRQDSFPALVSRLDTIEPDLHRPAIVKRVFVVPEELLVRGVKDRCVDLATDAFPRVLPILIEQVRGQRRCETFASCGGINLEISKE